MYKKPVYITLALTLMMCVFVAIVQGTGNSSDEYIFANYSIINHSTPTYVTASQSQSKVQSSNDDVDQALADIGGGRPKLPGLSSGDWDVQLAAKGNDYYTYDKYFEKISVGSNTYLAEQQTGTAYSYIPKSTSDTIRDSGCLMYAIAAIYTNMLGSLVTVEDQINADGGPAVWDNGKWSTNSYGYAGHVGWADTASSIPTRVEKLNNYTGNNITVVTGTKSADYINEQLLQGNWILLHVKDDTQRKYSGGGQHWFIICDVDATGNWYTLQISKTPVIYPGDQTYLFSVVNQIFTFSN